MLKGRRRVCVSQLRATSSACHVTARHAKLHAPPLPAAAGQPAGLCDRGPSRSQPSAHRPVACPPPMESDSSDSRFGATRSRGVRLMLASSKERVEVIRPWGVDKFSDSSIHDVVRALHRLARLAALARLRRFSRAQPRTTWVPHSARSTRVHVGHHCVARRAARGALCTACGAPAAGRGCGLPNALLWRPRADRARPRTALRCTRCDRAEPGEQELLTGHEGTAARVAGFERPPPVGRDVWPPHGRRAGAGARARRRGRRAPGRT